MISAVFKDEDLVRSVDLTAAYTFRAVLRAVLSILFPCLISYGLAVTAVTCAVRNDITAGVLSVLLGNMASGCFSRAVSLSVVGF